MRLNSLDLHSVPRAAAAAFALAATLFSAPVSAQYRFLSTGPTGALLLETETVSRAGDIVSANLITMPRQIRSYKGQKLFMLSGNAEMNCRTGQFRYTRISFRGSGQELLGVDATVRQWAKVESKTPVYGFYDYACAGDKNPLSTRTEALTLPMAWTAYQQTYGGL